MPNFSTDPQKTPTYMGCQTSQYSLCISVTQFTFYMVNCFLFMWSTFYFYIGQCKMQTADFRLQTADCRLQTADCRLEVKYRLRVNTDCRLQTGGKVKTEGKIQTEDCRPGVKCRLGSVYDRSIDLIVKHKSEVLNILKLLIQSTIPRSHLPFQHKTKVRETGFYCPSNRNCRCVMNVCRYYF